MKLLSISTNTMMYLCPLLKIAGNYLVWSVYIASLALNVLTYMSCIFLGGDSCWSVFVFSHIFIDRTFWHCFFMWPFVLSSDWGNVCWLFLLWLPARWDNFLLWLFLTMFLLWGILLPHGGILSCLPLMVCCMRGLLFLLVHFHLLLLAIVLSNCFWWGLVCLWWVF